MRFPKDDHTPRMSDPVWADLSTPLFKYLAEPRTWREMNAWRRGSMTEDRMRHCLAWLDQKGVIYDILIDDVCHWLQTGATPKRSPEAGPARPLGGAQKPSHHDGGGSLEAVLDPVLDHAFEGPHVPR